MQRDTTVIDRTATTQQEKPAVIEREQAKERKPKLSREEIEMLLERQREHSGPAS